jgi:Leucine-rich repeat (LRR) protein
MYNFDLATLPLKTVGVIKSRTNAFTIQEAHHALTTAKELNLSHGCRMTDISFLADLSNLRMLNISNNLIADITPIASLTNLESLYLQWNHIKNIDPLANLNDLQILNLERNQVTDVTVLLQLPKLRLLDARFNPLTDACIESIKKFNFQSSVAKILFTEPE